MLLEQTSQKPRATEPGFLSRPKDRLAAAHNYAVIGAFRFAQEACALLLADELPAIAAKPELIVGMVEVLLLSEAYEQLGRFLRAITGATVVFEAAPLPHMVDQPDLAMHAVAAGLRITVKAGALRRPDAVDLARRWSTDILRAINN